MTADGHAENNRDDAGARVGTKGVTRRTLMKGAVWAVPAVAVAAAAPAMATSATSVSLVGVGSFAVTRCDTILGLSFCAFDNGAAAPAGWTIQVTLPNGLHFASGPANTQSITTTAGGCAAVPAISVTGTAGNYAITGTITAPVQGPAGTAQITGTVAAAPGAVTEFRSKYTWGQGAAASTWVRSSQLTANEGGIAGNNTGQSYAAVVVADGTVQYWSGDTGWTGGSVTSATLPGVAGAVLVSTFDANGVGSGSGVVGGVAAGATSVWQWYDDGSGPVVRTVSGPGGPNALAGTVLDVQSFAGRSYVLTTAGVWSWVTQSTGTGNITPVKLALPSGTPSASRVIRMSAFYDAGNNDTGVAVIIGANGNATSGQLALSTGGGGFANITGTGSGSIQSVAAGSAGLAAITAGGVLYTYGDYGHPGIVRAWTQRDTGVSSVSVWGYGAYFGGVYIKNGAITELFDVNTGSNWIAKSVGGMTGKTITKTFSSDGTYLALASDGTVYKWYGNLDNSDYANANPQATPLAGVSNVVDLNVWGYHNGTYYGGGYVIQGSNCP